MFVLKIGSVCLYRVRNLKLFFWRVEGWEFVEGSRYVENVRVCGGFCVFFWKSVGGCGVCGFERLGWIEFVRFFFLEEIEGEDIICRCGSYVVVICMCVLVCVFVSGYVWVRGYCVFVFVMDKVVLGVYVSVCRGVCVCVLCIWFVDMFFVFFNVCLY